MFRGQAPLHIPTDYQEGYEKARRLAPEMAENYIRHTLIGDPLGEAAAEDLRALGEAESSRLIKAAMNQEGEEALRNAPESLRKFFEDAGTPPDWLDYSALAPAIRLFHRNSWVVLVAFVAGVLIEGFTTNIAKSFFITGRLRDAGAKRLSQNNRHMMEIFLPGGLQRYGEGWKLSVRIRIVHARLRQLLNDSDDWDSDAWGVPISAAQLGFAISSFSARLLKHMKTLGIDYDAEEYDSFMDLWRYTGHLMGIPETILYRNADEALKLYDVGLTCEPTSIESIVLAHSLVQSAPLIVGVTDSQERRKMADNLYRLSKGLVGEETAQQLNFPAVSSFGAVWWFKMEQRHKNFLGKLPFWQDSSLSRFVTLMESSQYDEGGIRYNLPDRTYAELSRDW